MTVWSFHLKLNPNRGWKLVLSAGRPACWNGGTDTSLANAPISRSYRTPRFNVRRFEICQSSCAQPAAFFDVKFTLKSPTPIEYVVTHGEIAARFQVSALNG